MFLQLFSIVVALLLKLFIPLNTWLHVEKIGGNSHMLFYCLDGLHPLIGDTTCAIIGGLLSHDSTVHRQNLMACDHHLGTVSKKEAEPQSCHSMRRQLLCCQKKFLLEHYAKLLVHKTPLQRRQQQQQ
nr:hypothetical protein Iba_chr11aCG3620 [Ipomoea batatas]